MLENIKTHFEGVKSEFSDLLINQEGTHTKKSGYAKIHLTQNLNINQSTQVYQTLYSTPMNYFTRIALNHPSPFLELFMKTHRNYHSKFAFHF